MNVGRLVNLEVGVEGGYLVHLLFSQEPLVRLPLLSSVLHRLLTGHLAVEELPPRIYPLKIERNLPGIRDSIVPCWKLRALPSEHQPIIVPVYHALSRRRR